MHHRRVGPHAAAERSADVASHAPLVHRALPLIAHRAIRTRGTVVGSIAHEIRGRDARGGARGRGDDDSRVGVWVNGRSPRPTSSRDTSRPRCAEWDLTSVTFPAWPAGAVGSVVEVAAATATTRSSASSRRSNSTATRSSTPPSRSSARRRPRSASPRPNGSSSARRRHRHRRPCGRRRRRRARSAGGHRPHHRLSEAPRRRAHPPWPRRSRRHDRSVLMTDAATHRLDAERLAGGDVIDIGLVINGELDTTDRRGQTHPERRDP